MVHEGKILAFSTILTIFFTFSVVAMIIFVAPPPGSAVLQAILGPTQFIFFVLGPVLSPFTLYYGVKAVQAHREQPDRKSLSFGILGIYCGAKFLKDAILILTSVPFGTLPLFTIYFPFL